MDLTLFGSGGGKATLVAPIAHARRKAVEDALAEIGADPEAHGFNDIGEAVKALGRDRQELDPDAMILTFVGKMRSWFGAWATLSILTVGTVLVVQKVFSAGRSIATWLYDLWNSFFGGSGSAPIVGKAPAAPGSAGVGPRDGFYDDTPSDTARLASTAVLLSFLPAPVAIITTAAVQVLNGGDHPTQPKSKKDDLNT